MWGVKMIGKKGSQRVERPSFRAMLLVLVLAFTVTLAARPGMNAKGQDKGAPPAKSQEQQVYEQLAKSWTEFFSAKYDAAIKDCDPLLKLQDRKFDWVKLSAAHITARSYFAAGTQQSRAKAQQIWKQIEKNTTNTNVIRQKLSKALALEAEATPSDPSKPVDDAKLKSAIDGLQAIMKDGQQNDAVAETAILLGHLQVKAKQYDEAKKTWQFVVDLMTNKNSITKMELPEELAKPFADCAKACIAHLRLDRSAGLEEYEAASALLRQSRFAEAMKGFRSVVAKYLDSESAAKSQVAIGHCLVGLRQVDAALSHWEAFIKAKPAGSQRGQALSAVLDTLLEDRLDLSSSQKYAEIAKGAIPAGLADEAARDSWEKCQFDLQLRLGTIAFCTGKNEDAATAFGAAKALSTKKTEQDSLDSLIAAAKSGKAVVPQDALGGGTGDVKATDPASPAGKVATALSMGVIYLCADRTDRAQAFFDRVLGVDRDKLASTSKRDDKDGKPAALLVHPMQGATPAQVAFGFFGEAAVYQAKNQDDDAREQLLVSLKAFQDASFHDETLWRLASLILAQADAKFGKPAESSVPAAKPGDAKVAKDGKKDAGAANKAGAPAKLPTPQERETAEKAEKERLANLFKAQQEVLGYWQELLKRYPKSNRAEFAAYAIGLTQYEMAQAAPAGAKAEQLFKDAAFTLNRFCESWPRSQWAGDAYIRQVDIVLERTFAIKTITDLPRLIGEWARMCKTAKFDTRAVPWGLRQSGLTDEALSRCIYECLLRAAIIDYLVGNYDQAVAWLKTAEPTKPGPTEDLRESQIEIAGLYYCLKAIESKKLLTPQEALDAADTDELKLAIRLGDLYLESLRPDKAEILFLRVAEKQSPFKSVNTDMQSYAILRLGVALDRQSKKSDQALGWLNRFADTEFDHTHWKGDGLFQLALLTYNVTQNPRLSLPIYQEFLTKYPKHSLHELAHYYAIADACELGNVALAKDLAGQFMKAYPESKWTKSIQKRMNNVNNTGLNHRKGE